MQIIESCLEQAGYTLSLDDAREQLAVHDTAASCYASAQYNRAAYSLVSAILVMLAGMSVLFLAPPIIERRRRLQPIGPKLAAAGGRVAELAQCAGLRHPPTVMLGAAKQLRLATPSPDRIAARRRRSVEQPHTIRSAGCT